MPSPATPGSAVLTQQFLVASTLLLPSVTFQTPSRLGVDRPQYEATCIQGQGADCTYGFTVIASYMNTTPDTLFITTCLPNDPAPEYGVEAVDDTAEDAAYDPVWPCVGHDHPIVVAPRATRVDTLRLDGPNVRDGKTFAPMGRFEGRFRLIYKVGRCWYGRVKCNTLPEQERSEPFAVRLAR
jgi:hypothetical protein